MNYIDLTALPDHQRKAILKIMGHQSHSDKMKKYVIATRNVHAKGWDENDPAIIKARYDYDAGKIEMCQGRQGDTLILYAIPRKKKAENRKPWFHPVPESNVVTLRG